MATTGLFAVQAVSAALTLTLLLLSCPVQGLENGLIRTPPMGWSTWNRFHCGINENLVQEIAKAIVSTGLAK